MRDFKGLAGGQLFKAPRCHPSVPRPLMAERSPPTRPPNQVITAQRVALIELWATTPNPRLAADPGRRNYPQCYALIAARCSRQETGI
jgi:hypothetical protein